MSRSIPRHIARVDEKSLTFSDKAKWVKSMEKLKGKMVVVTVEPAEMSRTNAQNNSMHLYFSQVADALNDAGLEIRAVVQPGIEIPWTTVTVKELLWRPAQQLLLQKESTTALDKIGEIEKVWEVVNRHIGSLGVESIPFPSIEQFGRYGIETK